MSLVEFLLARIAEDEALARDMAGPLYQDGEIGTPGHSARIFAECEAKRRIVALADAAANPDLDPIAEHHAGNDGPWVGSVTLKLLALPYAGHPDYREEWKP